MEAEAVVFIGCTYFCSPGCKKLLLKC